ncbi:hypothetical protein C8R45DRAFT_1179258 [Mycena sanguinolenta]|nr:hypothetical protein C8R45DRAFT_1179258 [Mycena sanguinolenta]
MGISSSKIFSNPVHFATPVVDGASGIQPKKECWETFDSVIVGGSKVMHRGCGLRSRFKVERKPQLFRVIEAGKSPQSELNRRVLSCDRDKLLGGCSSINVTLYQRCAPESSHTLVDFSDWAKIGAEGWDAAEMDRQIFPQSLEVQPESPVSADRHNAPCELWPFLDAMRTVRPVKVGIPRIPDMNAGNGPAGVSHFASAVDVSGELVLEQTDGGEPRATGVLVVQRNDGRLYAVAAKREVIVSTGAIATLQLLMVSGIGPADELENHNIQVVRDLPLVGKNLLTFRHRPNLALLVWLAHLPRHGRKDLGSCLVSARWLVSGSGPVPSIAVPVGVFVHSESIIVSPTKDGKAVDVTAVPSGIAPDIEIFFTSLIVINNGFTKTPGKTGLTIGCVALSPTSRGTISLKSSNFFDHPLSDPKYLVNKHDLEVLIKATRLTLRIARDEPLTGSLELPEDSKDESTYFWPGDANSDTLTDQQIIASIKRISHAAWHPTSTTKMGASAETSVVDPQLRVRGVAGLRVIDASVFPQLRSQRQYQGTHARW